jgi:hypothetical protein
VVELRLDLKYFWDSLKLQFNREAIAVGVGAIIEQVAVVVPIVFLLIHGNQAVSVIVVVGGCYRLDTRSIMHFSSLNRLPTES